MTNIRTALLSMLVVAATPVVGQEIDHSHMDHGSTAHQPAAEDGQKHNTHGADTAIHSYLLLNRLEATNGDAGTGFSWEARGWVGTDATRLWLRSEGETVSGRTENADLQLLYGRSLSAWWDVVAGLRHDFRPGSSQTFAALGVQGLAPFRIELSAIGYIAESGQSAARLEAEHQLLLTNRLVLQPRVEAELYSKTDGARGTGSGLSTMQWGLRLRYEINRQFAPYIGVNRERAVGKTASLRRNASEAVSDLRLVAGVRAWF